MPEQATRNSESWLVLEVGAGAGLELGSREDVLGEGFGGFDAGALGFGDEVFEGLLRGAGQGVGEGARERVVVVRDDRARSELGDEAAGVAGGVLAERNRGEDEVRALGDGAQETRRVLGEVRAREVHDGEAGDAY